MKVLISGGAGFVGRRFARRLLDGGHKVTAVDDLSSGIEPHSWRFKPSPKFLGNLTFVRADLRDFIKTEPASNFDLIIHCAAIVGGRLKIDGDPLAVATDLSIDSEFLNWCVRGKPLPKVIYFSSSAVYPLNRQTRENACELFEGLVNPASLKWDQPDMTYGLVKFVGEALCQYAAKHYGLDVVIYRPFGGYGEDQSFDYPFPSIVRRIVNGENPVTVWGSGEQKRDFIHIEDVVSAVLTTMDKLKPGEALNLGAGVGTSFKDLALLIADTLGKKIKVVNDATKPEGVYARVAGIRKLDQLWKPTISLASGIRGVAQELSKK